MTSTPGPWNYSKCPCEMKGCNKYIIDHSGPAGMFEEADARLIAAAPDLLEACEWAVAFLERDILENNQKQTDAMKILLNTINKATQE